MYAPR
jgi:hypothetical protein